MKKFKRIIALLACASLCFMIVGCSGVKGTDSGNGKGASDDTKFSWWIYKGEESSYYTDYKENPAVNYLLKKTWGPENKTMDLEFLIPAGGSEKDNCVTLIGTGEYPDIMDLVVYPGSVSGLYTEGIAMDITEYVEQYMPNYLAFLDAHPDLKATTMNVVNGEKKYLGIYSYGDGVPEMWGGYEYRRDWIVKYGKNPTDGSSFTGAYTETNEDGTPNTDSWEDNVVFPSGGPDPVYISDWEWMMEIFQTAIEDQKITDGYCMSLYYPGYFAMGDIVCGFGGACGGWYLNKDSKIEFGQSSNNFRTYLQCMNTWYKNGWIDKAFAEHVSDQFYSVDDAKVRSGKVGLWYGLSSQFGGRMDSGEGYLDGIVVAAASQPINDIYGTAKEQNVIPYQMYQPGLEGNITIITDKAKDKDLPTLFSFLDNLYSEEGSLLKSLGLSKEQYDETKDPLYTSNNLTDGAYFQNEDGTYQAVEKVLKDGGSLASAIKLNRITGLGKVKGITYDYTTTKQNYLDMWVMYQSTGTLKNSFKSQLTDENASKVSKTETNVTEFCTKNVPGFIQGKQDPFNDDDWNSYVKALSKYSPDSVTQIYQTLYDSLK